MNNNTQIDCELRLVNTFLPLNPWLLQKVGGPLFEQEGWRAVALSYVPPPHTLRKVILEEFGGLASPALLSPSERRRLRNRYKRSIRRQFQSSALLSAARDHVARWRAALEAAGYRPDPNRIRKLVDIEAETRAEFEAMAQKPEEVREAFPPRKLGLGHREVEKLESALGISVDGKRRREDIDEYVQALLPHLVQVTFRPDAVKGGGFPQNSPVWKWMGVHNWPSTLNESLDLVANLIKRLGERKHQRQTVAYVLARLLRQEYGLAKGRNVDIDTFSTIEEARPHKAAQWGAAHDMESWEPEDMNWARGYEDVDLRMTWEDVCHAAPPAQREALELYLEADETERPLSELCRERGKDPNLVRNNFQAFRKAVLRKHRPA